MKLRKIIYHGTTVLRWGFIKSNGLLRSDMPKSFKFEEQFGCSSGYLYFTSNVDHAIMYGVHKSLSDMLHLDTDWARKINPNYRDPVVLGINASKLNIEIDPEVNMPLVQQFSNERNANIEWYRYQGDIKLKHLFAYKYCPFDSFDSNRINRMKEIINAKYEADRIQI